MTRKKKPEPERRVEAHPGVYPYETKTQGTRYRYQFDGPRKPDGSRGKPITKRGFPTEQDAWDAMQALKADMRLPGYIDPTHETLDAYFARWMRDTAHGRRASTNNNYLRMWMIFPESIRRTKLVDLTPAHVRAVYAQIVQTYAASTCKFARTVFRMPLKAAHSDRLIPFNPAEGIKLPVNRDAEAEAAFDPANVWSVEESNRFLAKTADDPHHTLWRLLLDSGLRIGEALALTWDDIDLDTRRLRVLRTVTLDKDGRETLGSHPKTKSSRRELGLEVETVMHLERHRTQQKVRRVELGPLWVDRGLVFDDGAGGLMAKGKAGRSFAAAVTAAGMRPLTLHGCRHSMAVRYLQGGESPAVVAERLGHKSSAFTLDVYAKVSSGWQMSAVDRMEAFRKRTG